MIYACQFAYFDERCADAMLRPTTFATAYDFDVTIAAAMHFAIAEGLILLQRRRSAYCHGRFCRQPRVRHYLAKMMMTATYCLKSLCCQQKRHFDVDADAAAMLPRRRGMI